MSGRSWRQPESWHLPAAGLPGKPPMPSAYCMATRLHSDLGFVQTSQTDPRTLSRGDWMNPAVREALRPQSGLMELTFQKERKTEPHKMTGARKQDHRDPFWVDERKTALQKKRRHHLQHGWLGRFHFKIFLPHLGPAGALGTVSPPRLSPSLTSIPSLSGWYLLLTSVYLIQTIYLTFIHIRVIF